VNANIRADMVEASAFPALVQRYGVRGVPLTVIDGRPAFEGALPAMAAVMEILKIVDPAKHARVDAKLRERGDESKVTEAKPGLPFDVIIVGAGPAAMAAALYAMRKSRRVGLIGETAGGQINNTALIENYPGTTQISGSELAQLFRHHLETYPVAERLHTKVTAITARDGMFQVVTQNRMVFEARCVIYAAGKRYRRLGVPGEERFVGRGISFCGTCDAPLYRDKVAAVVGGGNSAFTAARDLISYAREIHVVHMLDEFQADAALVEEVRKAPHVSLHMKSEVREFLGSDRLSGLRISADGGSRRFDLSVDGVFLEIGLVPNTEPLKALLKLNRHGEVPVDREQATEIPGLFAAGDATDEPDKQIVIAVGSGARAALAADRFLSRQELGTKTNIAA
jgi:NADH-dependent peroxiredoxin subunit F